MLRVADHFSHSDTGRARRANEDSYFARSPVFVVADGMGGAQAGEVASRVAVEAFERDMRDGGSDSAEEMLARRVQEANAQIHAMSQAEQERAGMGTTITAAHVGENDVAVAHVGDSRAYRLRGEEFIRLTEDHSLVEEMRRRGQLTAEEADEHPQRSIITRALGPEPQVLVDTHSWRGLDGDVYLLCSDGLTSMVPEARVADIVRAATSLSSAGRALIAAANDAGGRDNITVVLFRLEDVGGPDPSLDQPTTTGRAPKATQVRMPAAPPTAPTERQLPALPARDPGAPPDLTAFHLPAIGDTKPAHPAPPPPADPPPSEPEPDRLPPADTPTRESPRRLQPAAAPSGDDGAKRPRRRRFAVMFAILALVVIPLGLGGYIANQAVYFVGTNDEGFVTMYRGLPYSLPAGIKLYSVNYVSGVPLNSLKPARAKQLVDHTLRSHDDASDLIRELELGRVAS